MSRDSGMLARVPVLGIVTASDVAAGTAQPQVHPGIAGSQAFHASIARWRDVSYAVQMSARCMTPAHRLPLRSMAALTKND